MMDKLLRPNDVEHVLYIIQTGATLILLLLLIEALWWCFTVNRHAIWLYKHPSEDRRRCINWKLLYTASIMSAIYCTLTWILWVVHVSSYNGLTALDNVKFHISTLLFAESMMWGSASMASAITVIYCYFLIAKVTRLKIELYPLISKFVVQRWVNPKESEESLCSTKLSIFS